MRILNNKESFSRTGWLKGRLLLRKKPETAFSLVELIVVLGALGILSSLVLPNLLKMLGDSSNNAASAFMNSLAAECLQNYRLDDSELDKTPKLLENNGPPDDFRLEDGLDKCSYILIVPKNENDTSLASYGFRLVKPDGSPYIHKLSAFNHPDAEDACMAWASYKKDKPGEKDCDEGGNVEEIRATLAADAAKRERERQIESRYEAWLIGPPRGSGNYTADGKDIWAFRGLVVKDRDAYEEAVERACGRELVDALNKAKADNYDGQYTYTSTSGGCDIDTYLCSGTEVGTKDRYDACKEEERRAKCTAAEGQWIESKKDGMFSQEGCEAKWQCNGIILTSQADYEASQCGVKCTTQTVFIPDSNGTWHKINDRWERGYYENKEVCK